MFITSRRLFWLGVVILTALVIVAVLPLPVHKVAASQPTEAESAALEAAVNPESVPILASEPPPVQRDTCLHCHLTGEDRGVWTPTARWTFFGVAGLALAFGLYRSASTWVTRKPWKPLTARAVDWVDERYEIKEPLQKAMSKPVPRFARQWFYCLGGITFFLFLVQCVTGIMLAVYYKPSVEAAYSSILYIENEVRFGAAIRAIHHWAANGMIVMCVAHMIRVFITGAYRAPRELNWVGGMLLLILTLAFGFTGYLLPWDQRAFWATTVGTDIAGGVPDVGVLALVFLRAGWSVAENTLSRFFALHVLVLPAVTFILLGLHFLMIRRQGIARPL